VPSGLTDGFVYLIIRQHLEACDRGSGGGVGTGGMKVNLATELHPATNIKLGDQKISLLLHLLYSNQ